MKKICLLLICILFAFLSEAESLDAKKDSATEKGKLCSLLEKTFVIADYQNMRSTHVDHFAGFKVMAGYNFTPKFSLGLGVEDVYDPHHDDNGLMLSEIRFIPIIINARYLFGENRIIVPFVELSTGITFLKYYEKTKVTAGSPDITATEGQYYFGLPFIVQGKGLYTYFGSGVYFKVSKHFMPYLGIGFKGYNMTSNNLTINPHGINFEIGCKF